MATPTPTPVPTPHPATSAQIRAVQLYPELAVKGSLFNRTFLELTEAAKVQNPFLLTQVDWPLTIAQRAGAMLGVNPKHDDDPPPPPAPTPPPPVVIYVTPKPASSLDRGAYRMPSNLR